MDGPKGSIFKVYGRVKVYFPYKNGRDQAKLDGNLHKNGRFRTIVDDLVICPVQK